MGAIAIAGGRSYSKKDREKETAGPRDKEKEALQVRRRKEKDWQDDEHTMDARK